MSLRVLRHESTISPSLAAWYHDRAFPEMVVRRINDPSVGEFTDGPLVSDVDPSVFVSELVPTESELLGDQTEDMS